MNAWLWTAVVVATVLGFLAGGSFAAAAFLFGCLLLAWAGAKCLMGLLDCLCLRHYRRDPEEDAYGEEGRSD